MTGFGRAEAVRERYRVTVEARTVNHRFLDVAPRLPKVASGFEERLRAMVAGKLNRGRVDVFVSVEEVGEARRPVKVDIPLARGYLEALGQLREALALPGEVTLEQILGMAGVVTTEESTDPEALWAALEEAAQAALSEILRMREAEGARLAADLEQRLGTLAAFVEAIGERAPEVNEEYRVRLEERVRELLGDRTPDEGRLLQEVALMADRTSITEEIVRFRSHLTEATATLQGPDSAVGRKFDFLLQELNREANTIGSKGNDVQLARLVIAVKAELEKIREQVQNIE
jgi:uncharacterized protein (TIGR00255 family)